MTLKPLGPEHTLVIEGDDNDFEVDFVHPGCGIRDLGAYFAHACAVDYLLEYAGLDGAFKELPKGPGTYKVQAYLEETKHVYGDRDWDMWIEVLERDASNA
jgi:hypothetical protein